jgi:hypothetical protein
MLVICEIYKQLKRANGIIKTHGKHLYNTEQSINYKHKIKSPKLKLSKKDFHHVIKNTVRELSPEGVTSILVPKIISAIKH